jgi:cell division protein FtsB
MSETPPSRLSRLSILEKLISAVGVLALVVAMAYGYHELSVLPEQIQARTQKKADLNRSIDCLNSEIHKLENAPVRDLVTPRAIEVELTNQRDPQGLQLYNYTLWLDMPASRKKDISRVKYFFDDKSMRLKTHLGTQPSNSFAVSYLGWGCFSDVVVTIDSPGQLFPPIHFDMCTAIEQPESSSGPECK